jgi:hypothetical protein
MVIEHLEKVGFWLRIDSKQVIENTKRSILSRRRKRGFHTRITHTGFEAIGFRIQPLRSIVGFYSLQF